MTEPDGYDDSDTFTNRDVGRVLGISGQTLRAWRSNDVIVPSVQPGNEWGDPLLWSGRDMYVLAVLAVLHTMRQTQGVLRQVRQYLERYGDPLDEWQTVEGVVLWVYPGESDTGMVVDSWEPAVLAAVVVDLDAVAVSVLHAIRDLRSLDPTNPRGVMWG